MTPSFSIGDEVDVIGPDSAGRTDWVGKKFVIEGTTGRDRYYTAYHVPLFPASSLRLVEEELKIGDWVGVIGPCLSGYTKVDDCFQISQIEKEAGAFWYSTGGEACYPAKSLRKLTPEEITKNTNQLRLDPLEAYQSDYEKHAELIEAMQRGELPKACNCQTSRLQVQRDYILSRIADDMQMLLDEKFIVGSKMRAREQAWLGELEAVNEQLDSMREA